MSVEQKSRDRRACPACGSANATVAFTRQAWARQFEGTSDYRADYAALMDRDPDLAFERMMKCTACGTHFTDRVPTPAALDAFYRATYSNDGYMRKAKRKLATATRRISLLKWLVSGRRFLDVGCNVGFAVEAARRNGFDATGLDMVEFAIGVARAHFPGNTFLAGTIDDLPPGEGYDLVYCTEVAEHVTDVPGFLKALADTVKPGGLLFMTTPDSGHFSVRGRVMGWDQVKPPEHLTLFTKAGLRAGLSPWFRWVRFFPNQKAGIHLVARRR